MASRQLSRRDQDSRQSQAKRPGPGHGLGAARRVRVRRAALGLRPRSGPWSADASGGGAVPRRPSRPGGRTPGPGRGTGPRGEVWTTTGSAHPRSAAPCYGGPGGMGGSSPPCQLEVALRPVLPEPRGWCAVCGARHTTPTPDPATRPAARASRAISPRCPAGPGKRLREGRGLRRRCPGAAHETPSPRLAGGRGWRRRPNILMRQLQKGQCRAVLARGSLSAPTRTRGGSGPPGPGRRASRRRPRPHRAARGRGSPGRAGQPGGTRRHRRRGR